MKILCNESSSGRPPKKEVKELKEALTNFYDKEYKPLTKDTDLDYTHLNTILDYLTISLITMYENNIKLHYIEYIERYVNVIWKKKETIEKIKKKTKNEEKQKLEINEFYKQIRTIKHDIIENPKEYKSDKKYHIWIKKAIETITPNKTKYQKDNLYYDLQCKPQDYLPCMIRMMKEIEKEKVMIYNVFPMRNEIIPKSIKLDTTTLVHLIMTKKQGNKTEYLFKGNLKNNEDKIWKFFFRTERQCFKKLNYSFHHMIETDGVSCSIVLIRSDLIGKRIPNEKIETNKEQYIDELDDYKKLKNKKIVGIDPNIANDIIYCVDSDNKKANEFRYTKDSIRKECKTKKYAKIILEFKKEKINKKTIIQYETELSTLNRKTLNKTEFKKYIKKKNTINHKLYEFYNKYIFRKLKLNSYLNRLKHEQKMINNFKKIFGTSDKTIVCFGDYSNKNKHMKYNEATKGVGMRNLFRKNGFDVYLVNEFRTSCMCSKCKNEKGRCEYIKKRENPRPYRTGEITVHGLLSCKNCNTMWNRDVNSSINIHRIAEWAIKGKERPKYLCREKKKENMSSLGKTKNSVKVVALTKP